MSSLLDLFCIPVEDPADEPTTSSNTSSSSDGSECPSNGTTPTSEPVDYLTQLLSSPRSIPLKRKGRSLAETVEILKRQKIAEIVRKSPDVFSVISASSPAPSLVPVINIPSPIPRFHVSPSPTTIASMPPTSIVPFHLPVFGPSGQAAAERLASMVVKEREQQLASVVSFEKEKEVKNQIKQMTSSITAENYPTYAEDDKRFACQICSKKFANKFLLNKHIFIHTGLRPHQCPDCHKSFNRKDNLLRHRKTHVVQAREERATQAINSMMLANSIPTRHPLQNAGTTPETLLMTLFAAQSQQQKQHV